MSIEVSLHEIEDARIKRIHAGDGERAPVRVWEVKPRVRTQVDEEADNQSVLSQSAAIMKRALKSGAVKLAPVKKVEATPEAGKRLLPGQVAKVTPLESNQQRRARFLAMGLTGLGTVRKRSPNGTRKIYIRKKQEVA